jgi:hypothetical protein
MNHCGGLGGKAWKTERYNTKKNESKKKNQEAEEEMAKSLCQFTLPFLSWAAEHRAPKTR